jgi:hypothetical protein
MGTRGKQHSRRAGSGVPVPGGRGSDGFRAPSSPDFTPADLVPMHRPHPGEACRALAGRPERAPDEASAGSRSYRRSGAPLSARGRGVGNTHEMPIEEREQVSVGRREQRQARLVHAYCGNGAVVAPSVGEGKSEPDCRRCDEAEALADCSRERPLARRRLAPRRRGVALSASRSADSGHIRSYTAGAQQSQRARRW